MKFGKLLAGLALALGATAGGGAAQAADVTLRVGTFLPTQGVWHEPLAHFIETANDNDVGVTLEIVADPSAVSPFQLGEAVSSGVIDVAYMSGAFYTTLVPEADALKLLNVPVAELRENGAMDLIDEVHRQKMGTHFLGKLGDEIDYYIYTGVKIDEPDFSGLDVRGQPAYRPFLEALGANVVQMPGSEIYSAMESGVVDGYAWPLWGIQDLGLLEVTKFRIEPGFYNSEIAVLVNEDAWSGLDDAQRSVVTQAMIETEQWFIDYRNRVDAQQRSVQADAGIETITFSEEEGRAFRKTANDAAWTVIEERTPDFAAAVKPLGFRAD
ncbi:TRAP transporter substrate-binding protein DctP [Amorphus orientalis]|uniref:TRAP-type C4-dicarboxylate transport system substrate-binding protein n=1 Tax=Amorphus orientalis TaxID=649198 RepID=A0AAE3VLZ4_9HYPH|nr:TRAP transporter substrate-binding protein DctP [Amorphus orientalis]MDQ0314491.1 TRAP-type C4-dicarboxylate transport system substrate-binding protein [Amorphus orientalis]